MVGQNAVRERRCLVAMLVSHALLAHVAGAQRSDTTRGRADSVQAMPAITTTATAVSARLLSVGFAERQRTSGLPPAHFVTRMDIERVNPGMLREMLDRLGSRARGCANGSVFIDGVLATGGANDSDGAPRRTRGSAVTNSLARSEQLDRISPRDVEGMEIYVGASQIPTLFRTSGVQGTPPSCVIVIWLRSS